MRVTGWRILRRPTFFYIEVISLKKKPNVYIPVMASNLLGTAAGFVVWGVLIMLAVSVYAFKLNSDRAENNKFFTEPLKNITDECTMEVTVRYDVEPIDFVLISPRGSRYAADGSDSYIVDTNQKSIKMVVHTQDTGAWSIDRNQKSNNVVDVSTEQLPFEELYITRVSLIPDQNLFAFTVKLDSDKRFTQELNATATLESKSLGEELELYDGTIELNRPTSVKLLDGQIPYADDWELVIETHATGAQASLDQPVDGLNVKTYTGNTNLLYRRNGIVVKKEDHDTAG